MSQPVLAIVNRTTTISDTDLAPVVAALKRQLDEHLQPAWWGAASLATVPMGGAPPEDAWRVLLVDHYDAAPSLVGQHKFAGVPTGFVDVGRAAKAGLPWSAVLSHEVCEMVVDPWASLCVQAGDTILSLEVCDPVEGSLYSIDGVLVSNFVLPTWFRKGSPAPWDFQKALVAPLTLARGGYLSSTRAGGWSQAHAAHAHPLRVAAHPFSRRGRRGAPDEIPAAPAGLELPPPLWNAVCEAHASPGRAYHTLAHVREMLHWLDEVGREVGWLRPCEVFLAALFHDAVYIAGAHDNEERSAALARASIERWLPVAALDVARVEELILLTAKHGALVAAQVDDEAALFLDCDMAILGTSETRFDEYDRAIAVEYAALPTELYAAGRRRFLERLLAAEHIYHSPYLRARLERNARRNLARALAT